MKETIIENIVPEDLTMKKISKAELANLLLDSVKLEALYRGGVYNWSGYHKALEDYGYNEFEMKTNIDKITEKYEDI